MRTGISWCFVLISLLGCSDESLAPTGKIDDMTDPDAVLKHAGMFMNGPYGSVGGMAEIFQKDEGTWEAKLAEFSTSNGPDLYVYLSKEIMPVHFISLGKLQSTNGNQIYPIPGTPDFNEYKYICIHCKEYNHLFGYALLQPK